MVAACCALVSVVAVTGVARADGLTVTGMVVDEDGVPVPGALVTVFGSTSPPQSTTFADGTFIVQVPAGILALGVGATPPANRPELIVGSAPITMTGPTTGTATPTLRRGGTITVTVTAGGLPADSEASLYRTSGPSVPVGTQATDGRMRFELLQPGTYQLVVGSRTPGFAAEWYPSTPYRSRAQSVYLEPGGAVSFAVDLEREARITGRVLQPNGSPDPNADGRIFAQLAGARRGDDPTFSICRDDAGGVPGRYVVACLHPNATYVVSASGDATSPGAYFRDADNPLDATPVGVAAGATTTDIDVQLPEPPPPIDLIAFAPSVFAAGTTTTGVRMLGANFPASPRSMEVGTTVYFGDVPISIVITQVLSPSEALVTVTVGWAALTVTGDRTVNLMRYNGSSDFCDACFAISPPTGPPPPSPPPAIATVVPARLLETRIGPSLQTVDRRFQGIGEQAAGSVVELQVTGRGNVPADAAAVMLNVTAVQPREAGFVTVYPCGEDRPLASSVNFGPGAVVPNAVLAKVGTGGTVCLYTSAATHLLADVNGFVPAGGSPSTVVPARLLETRIGPAERTTDRSFEGIGEQAAGSVVELQVTGRGNVPADASAVMLNVAAVRPRAAGFVTVYPCGEARPLASSLNFGPGEVVPNAVLAKVGTGGKVCLYTSAATHLLADVNGFVPAGGSPSTVVPARLLDTRVGPTQRTVDTAYAGLGELQAGTVVALQVAGRGGIPVDAATAMLNVTAVLPRDGGFITVFPCDERRPLASSLNFGPGVVVPNAVLAKVASGGTVCLYTSATTHLLVDVLAGA